MRWLPHLRPIAVAVLILLPALAAAQAGSGQKLVIVTSNGWHSGIVVARADLPAGAIPESADFPAAAYLEFGWGDREYYPAPKKTIGMTLGAIAPGPAIVHMVGHARHPRETFPGIEIVAVRMTSAGFQRLVWYLHDSFERGGAARARASAKGLYAFSSFYPGTGSFHLFNTCNTWAARALAAAGLPVAAAGVQRAEQLMVQVRRLAAAASPATLH